jgi:hypothetical protein
LEETELSNKLVFFDLTANYYFSERWPNDICRGVYFIFGVNEKNQNETGVYVGKASFNSTIGKRLYVHFDKYKNSKCFYLNEHSKNPYVVELVTSISLEKGLVYMISSLEEFLITELKENGVNLLNTIGN